MTSGASWGRTITLVVAFSAVSLVLSWVIAPLLAFMVTSPGTEAAAATDPGFLALDLLLTCLAVYCAAYGAALLSRGQAILAAAGVGAVGWLVYFIVVGGFDGMVTSTYPLWYEFFPCDIVGAALAAFVAKRARPR